MPSKFPLVALEKITRIFAGSSAPQDRRYFAVEGPCFIRVRDVSSSRGDILTQTRDCLSPKAIAELPLVKAKKGTVVFPKSGAAIATNNRSILGVDGYIVSHLMALEANRELVCPEWIFYALRCVDMVHYANNPSYPSLKAAAVKKIKIPLPPLSEQRQIIARLRQELQDCDKINRVVESEFEKTRQISVALLRDTFRKMKINRCPFVALAKIIAEATSGFACGQRDPKGIVQVRMHNISNEFALVWETVTRIPKRALDPKHYFLPGDIVFNNTNSAALVGKSALFVGGKEPIVFSNHMTRLRVDREICLPEFLLLYLRDQWNQGLFSRICARWVGQSAVRSAKLMQLSIPLPPMAEQRRIVKFLHAQLEDIAKISAAVERQLESARALPQAVLRRAFSRQ